jgi:uncharacterized protein YndB with AHSA1/START domain
MPEPSSPPVREEVLVDVPVERAFEVFTSDMAGWWPPEHHLLDGELAEIVLEPRAGGRIYDRATDGSECQWARVLAWDPPHRLVFSWDISLQWTVETDPERTSEVEVRFTPEGNGRTRVALEHRHIERHGEGWEGMHSAVGSPDGWAVGLGRFADHVAAVRSTPS